MSINYVFNYSTKKQFNGNTTTNDNIYKNNNTAFDNI